MEDERITTEEDVNVLLKKIEEINKKRNLKLLEKYQYLVGKCFKIESGICLVKKLDKFDLVRNDIWFICDEIDYYSGGCYDFSSELKRLKLSFSTNIINGINIDDIDKYKVPIEEYNKLIDIAVKEINNNKI